jgi:expansin (peptidoglycan-binding protein)
LNNTFYGNSTDGSGGGISNQGNIVLINTIVANSLLGGDCYGSITDGGHNIDSDGTCGLDPANGSMPNTDPALGPLQNNGGPTLTHALLWGSPAIDAGDDAQCPETDQRGVLRPQDGDNDGWAVCDIGSYEVERSQVSPNLVGISGSLEGMVDRTYTFTATVEPVSTTLWLTYTWQASGQLPVTHTNERTDTVSYTWDNPGAQHITITASNDFGAVMDTHVITITDQPIESLTANNDSPNLLREVTTLSATITSGTNVVYTWDFGDGEVGEGEVVTHTYAAEGVYTATVSAMNSVSSLSETTVVTITVSAPTYWEYLPLVFKPPAAANPVHEGIATYYDATGDGACMFGPSPDDLMVAAMNAEEYDNAGVCGAYVHVIGPQGEVTVRIVDLCPECLAGHLDLSREAFALIAELAEGRVDITWQVVSPELAGPIAYHLKDGSNQWWTAVQVRNHRNPVAKLEYLDESGMWVAVPRTAYNYFVQTDPGMGEGPYTFRVTDWYGNVLVDSGIPHVEDGTVDGSAQFPPGP